MCGPAARRATWLVASLLLAWTAFGCGSGTDTETGPLLPPITRTVTGFVGNASTGRGITNAVVQIGSITVATDTHGEFSAPNIPLSDQAVRITATSYLERQLTLPANQSTLDVRLQPVVSNGDDIELPPGSPAL